MYNLRYIEKNKNKEAFMTETRTSQSRPPESEPTSENDGKKGVTLEDIDRLRADQRARLEDPGVDKAMQIEASIEAFMDEKGVEGSEHRAEVAEALKEASVLETSDEDWEREKELHKDTDSQLPEGVADTSEPDPDKPKPVSHKVTPPYPGDVHVAGESKQEKEPTADKPDSSAEKDSSEAEKEKNKERDKDRPPLSDLVTPVEVLHLRIRQASVYDEKLGELQVDPEKGFASDPADSEGAAAASEARRVEAMREAAKQIDDLTREHLAGYEDDENYEKALEFLRKASIDEMPQDEWRGDAETNSGMEQADDFSRELAKAEAESEARTEPEGPEREPDTPEPEKTEPKDLPPDPSDDDGKKDDSGKPPEGDEAKKPKEIPYTPEQRAQLHEIAREVWKEVEELGDELSSLIAKRMKKGEKFARETQDELDSLYERYNQALQDFNLRWIGLKRDELQPNEEGISDEEKEKRQKALVCEATKLVVNGQGHLREKVRGQYVKGPWRRGVAFASKYWNHENKYARWGTRIGFGAVASGVTLMTAGGAGGFVGGTILTVGAVKGAAAGAMGAFMRKSSTGPGVVAENDFNLSSYEKEQDIDTLLAAAGAQGKSAMEGATREERNARETARSPKNLGKGALWGAAIGEVGGLGVNLAQTIWDLPSDISETVDRVQDRPYSGGGGIDNSTASPSSTPESLGMSEAHASGAPSASPSGGIGVEGGPPSGGGGAQVGPGNGGVGGEGPSGGGQGAEPQPESPTGSEVSGEQLADQYADNPDAGIDIELGEGPYQTFDELGVPRSMWEELYRDDSLINELVNNGDAYRLTDQGYGFGWSNTGPLSDASIEAIYRHAGIA
jgi:hypothetical protein